jgi:hypothetical protein
MAITKSNKLELSLDHNEPNEKMDTHLYSLVTSEGLLSFDSQNIILTRALALPCTLKVFLSWINEQETSKRRGGDVFIHPTVKSNRYLPTQQNTRWPDTPIARNGQKPEITASDRTCQSVVTGRVRSCRELTVLWPDARPRPISPVIRVPYWNVTGRADHTPVASD